MSRSNEEPFRVAVNHGAVMVAAAAALAVGATEWMKVGGLGWGVGPGRISPWEALGEFARCVFMAYVLARLVVRTRVAGWKGALALGGWTWLGFQAAILLGSVVHEHMAWRAYAFRAGYALIGTLVAVAVLEAWPMRDRAHDSLEKEAPQPTLDGGPSAGTRAGVNYKAVVLAAIAAIAVGAVWYSPALFGDAWARLKPSAGVREAIPPTEIVGELVRSCVVAYVFARLLVASKVADWKGAVLLGGWLWLGFHQTLLLFSVIHEHMPLALYAIHAGHGLANDLVIAAIVGAWRPRVRTAAVALG